MNNNTNNTIAVFGAKEIRRIWHDDEWWFSIVDVVAILTDQTEPLRARKYWNKLAQERMKALYEQKGYPGGWIDKRLRGIAIRQNLTDEWKERGITSQKDYAILTAEISKATFGMTPSEYKKHKNIPAKNKANLRDNMTDLELQGAIVTVPYRALFDGKKGPLNPKNAYYLGLTV